VDAVAAGFHFEYSGTTTYQSNQQMMHLFVDHILTPYFKQIKAEAGHPPLQKTLREIDVWSVYRSEEFCNWMQRNHPLILDFVPGRVYWGFSTL
jgi:hypothetical protein